MRRSLNKETLAIYWRHIKVYWPQITICTAGILIVIGVDIVLPIIFKRFFDQLAEGVAHGKTDELAAEIRHTIWIIAAVMATGWGGWRLLMWMLAQFESNAMRDVTNSSFEYLHGHSTRFFSNSFAGALTTRVKRFTTGLEIIVDQCVTELGQTILKVLLIIGVLFWYNTVLGAIFAAWTVALATFNFLFARYKMKYDLARADMDTKVTAHLADTVANALNLKLFASAQRENEKFRDITREHHRRRVLTWNIGWVYEGVQGLSIRSLDVGLLFLAVGFWRRDILTVGDIIMLRSYLGQLAEEVRSLGGNVRRIYEALADANEMTEILVTPHEITDRSESTLSVTSGEVEFRSVRFSYDGERPVLSDFNLKTKPGEKVGIVGPSGGGKSTVLKILARLYDLMKGQILIDGQDIAAVTQESLHRNIAFVPQDPVLFHRSLMENIRYSRPSATDEEVLRAAKLAHCHEFISTFPKGYETLVGERGVKLSGGERQRVAIARAILMDAPILVLDEATSSLDSESELYIQDSLAKIIPGRTVIAVAHRLSTIKKMDRIVVVKDGTIVEEGRHDLLLKIDDGHYQKLWELQTEGTAEELVNSGQ